MTTLGSTLDSQPKFINNIINDINDGKIKIPKFQRSFVWNTEQALNLLDSIAHNYPIGSLLFWETSSKIADERNIGEFKLPDTAPRTPTSYVLDGQQRLTVIYSALSPNVSGNFEAAYDLREQKFIEYIPSSQLPMFPDTHIFPLRYFYDITKLLNFRTKLQVDHPEGTILGSRLDHLINVLQQYKIPVVILADLTVEEVCPIFERINSSGTRLSVFDLMVAATWSSAFDLNDAYRDIIEFLEPKGFDDIEGDTILKCLAAIQVGQVSRNDILKLRDVKPDLRILVARAKDTLLRATDLLATEFKVHNISYLPYEAILVILCALLSKHRTLNVEQVKRVREWFWRSGLSERYRGAADSFISNDIRQVEAFVIHNNGSPEIFGVIPNVNMLCTVSFVVNSSRSKAFILALAANNPKNITNGAVVDTNQALSVLNRKQYHHIFPKAHLRRTGTAGNKDALANICMLSASENQKISDTPANLYLPDAARVLGPRALDVFYLTSYPILLQPITQTFLMEHFS